MHIDDVLGRLRGYAPESLALGDDPIGLLVSPRDPGVNRVAVCLDATLPAARAAAAFGASLVVAHHPLIYLPLKRIDRADGIGAVVALLIEQGIGLYAMHTNWDAAQGGINDTLAARLGLGEVRDLRREGASPVARLARAGTLAESLTFALLLEHVAARLGCAGTSALRHNAALLPARERDAATVRRIAVCGGAGASTLDDALAAGAETLVTADVRHHEFIDAAAKGLLLIDAGHEATERPGMERLAERLSADEPALRVAFAANDGGLTTLPADAGRS